MVTMSKEYDEVKMRAKKLTAEGFKWKKDFFFEPRIRVVEYHERQVIYNNVREDDYKEGKCEGRKRYGDAQITRKEKTILGYDIVDINGEPFNEFRHMPGGKCCICGAPKHGGGRCFDCLGVEIEDPTPTLLRPKEDMMRLDAFKAD
jgi:hypothetical protein